MKNIIFKLLALLILIMHSSCSTRKLNRQILKNSVTEESEIRMQDFRNDKLEAKRKILLTDSGSEHYSAIIFPTDTFSFSVEYGFKGKAEKIELLGKLRRVISRTDSAGILKEMRTGRSYEGKERSEKSDKSRMRYLEVKRWSVLLAFIVFLGIILFYWWLKRWVM